MELISGYKTALLKPAVSAGSAVTIGNFDGVHRGHRDILKRLKEKALKLGCPTVVYTFNPHPRRFMRPELDIPLLLTREERVEVLASCGVDVMIEEPFDQGFSQIPANKFFEEILIQSIKCKALFVGYDFCFGKNREGDIPLLKNLCQAAKIYIEVVQPCLWNGEAVSSSRIRKALSEGAVRHANELLGYPFFLSGKVVAGESRGKALGFPTANFALPDGKIMLSCGVYATRTSLADAPAELMGSVTNVGVNPTFHDTNESSRPVVETYILDRKVNCYGQKIRVEFIEFLRPEIRFETPALLVRQIHDDIAHARRILTA